MPSRTTGPARTLGEMLSLLTRSKKWVTRSMRQASAGMHHFPPAITPSFLTEMGTVSRPDGWGVISWNEVAENTHIRPMKKWGYFYLRLLTELMNSTP